MKLNQTRAAVDFNRPESAKAVGGALADDVLTLVQQLRGATITDPASLEQAVIDRQTLGDMIKKVQGFFAPFKKMAHDLHHALCAREAEIVAPLDTLDRIKREAIRDFKFAQDRLRAAREREAADQQRREEQDRATAMAAEFERAGDPEMAAAVVAEAIAAPPPVVVLPDVTKQIQGLKFVRRYFWRYSGGPKDIDQTPPQIVARTLELIPRQFCAVDEKKIGAYARSMKGTGAIPGIEFYHVDDPVR